MSGKNGTVALFLSPLPASTQRRDLLSFVRKQLRLAGLRGLPLFDLCTNCTILRVTDRATGTVEYHGLVEVRPARIAMQAIRILQGQELNGVAIEVRRYRHRTMWGAPRQRLNPGDSILVARPLPERRRANLALELVKATPAAAEGASHPSSVPAESGFDLTEIA